MPRTSSNGIPGAGGLRHPGVLKRHFPPSTIVVTLVAAALSAYGVLLATADPRGDNPLALAFLASGAIPTCFSVLAPLWGLGTGHPPVFESLSRVVLFPLLVAPVFVVVNVVTVSLPVAAARITASRGPHGSHYHFPADDGPPALQMLVLGGLAGLIVSMLAGLAAWVFVALPWSAFRRPAAFAEANQLSTAPQDRAANARGSRLLALVIMLAFAVPTMIVVGSNYAKDADGPVEALLGAHQVFTDPGRYWGNALWVAGMALVPVILVVAVLVRIIQRPDHGLRAATGWSAWGGDRGAVEKKVPGRAPGHGLGK